MLAVGCALVATACGFQPDVIARESDRLAAPTQTSPEPDVEPDPDIEPEPIPEPEPDDTSRQDSVDDPVDTTVPPNSAPNDDEVDELLAELQEAGFCDPADVEDEGVVTAMHFVVQGVLQEPCYVDQPGGDDVADVVVDDDPRLLDAWNLLEELTPIELLDDISIIAGYEACASCSTLAFVTQLDEAGTFFIVAVDVDAGEADPDELRLTMMHELTHVFGQAPGEQLVLVDGPSECDTFYNGIGCFTEDSYMWAWIQEFWPPQIRDTLPEDGSVSSDDDAADRCAADAAYTGSYAAVHPEEDFAETFSAYVFDVEVDPALTAKIEFFDRYPEFVSIRESARAAGYSGTPANFDGCGF